MFSEHICEFSEFDLEKWVKVKLQCTVKFPSPSATIMVTVTHIQFLTVSELLAVFDLVTMTN
jgi:hypothetical protein